MSDGAVVTDTGVGVVTPEQMGGFLRSQMMLGVRTRQIRDQVQSAIERRQDALAVAEPLLALIRSALQERAYLDALDPSVARREVERGPDPPPVRPLLVSLTLAPHGPTAAGVTPAVA